MPLLLPLRVALLLYIISMMSTLFHFLRLVARAGMFTSNTYLLQADQGYCAAAMMCRPKEDGDRRGGVARLMMHLLSISTTHCGQLVFAACSTVGFQF